MSLLSELKKFSSKERKESNQCFFKTKKGQYGYKDVFLGVAVSNIRKVAKNNLDLSFKILEKNISSKYHELRLCVILILVENFKGALKDEDIKRQKRILNFYLKHLEYVNNWDLVDSSAHHILGQAILNGLENKQILENLAVSEVLWKRRVGIVATWAFIRNGNISITLKFAKKLLNDKEDLIHKAVGWMLREAWKKDSKKVEKFLEKNYQKLPRTTLRYAIEKIEKHKRKEILQGIFV